MYIRSKEKKLLHAGIAGFMVMSLYLPCALIFLNNTIYGYSHRDSIAILSYGSLVHWPEHSITKARLQATKFSPTHLLLPIGFSTLKNKDRITAIIDTQYGERKTIWAAKSLLSTFDAALQNLAAREGAHFDTQKKQYDTSRIYYLIKRPASFVEQPDTERVKGTSWILRKEKNIRQKIPADLIAHIIEWADSHAYTAVLWASCPALIMSQIELVDRLLRNSELLHQAQHYITHLPEGPTTALEKAIFKGAPALIKFLESHQSVPAAKVSNKP